MLGPLRSTSVSYTHLDVYKRQAFMCSVVYPEEQYGLPPVLCSFPSLNICAALIAGALTTKAIAYQLTYYVQLVNPGI